MFLGTVVGTKVHDLVQARTQGLKVAINTRKVHCLDMPNRAEREYVTLLWRTQH